MGNAKELLETLQSSVGTVHWLYLTTFPVTRMDHSDTQIKGGVESLSKSGVSLNVQKIEVFPAEILGVDRVDLIQAVGQCECIEWL